MEKKSRTERQHEQDRKHFGKERDLHKKQKLKKVIKEWSKGESKWTFKPDSLNDDYASFERSSDIVKRHNKQNTARPIRLEKNLSELSGIVMESRSLFLLVHTEEGDFGCKTFRSTISENPDSTLVVTGDTVTIKPVVLPVESEIGEGLITRIKARRTKLCRSRERETNRSGEAEHVIASNIDLLFIISSMSEPPFRAGIIDRYFAYAEYERITPILLINKIDLDASSLAERYAQLYRDLGYEVFLVSAAQRLGLQELKSKLIGKTSVFSGHSGVGKTSIVNELTGLNLATADVSEKNLKGSHTTSYAKMLSLRDDSGNSGFVIDTPGIREFGLAFVPREELRHCFVEFRQFAPHCRFPSCSHTLEPDCAVISALSLGNIAPSRYESYISIFSQAVL